ncbi:MAG: nicotinate-nicotinamide nucleotide adenylyltransferase [Acholeplasmatales bacterium]|jgi:nicotinate-nucleotide adenylyltransferase|nr:nicotinate-nicotinamide nucleotide adenylyltransferase [Acholeplasmatales bacterium]
MNIVFGGSFNPVTKAHKQIIDYCFRKFKISNFIIVLAGTTYYKEYNVSYESRKAMLKLVLKRKKIIFSPIEEKEYHGTYNTLVSLSKTYKDIHFLLGADQLLKINDWIDSTKLINEFKFIVFNRDNIINEEIKNKYNRNFLFINNPIYKFSSSLYRENPSLIDIIDKRVYKYIKDYNLYDISKKEV